MEEDLHKEGIEKYYKERLEKIYYSTRKNILSEIAYPFKTYSSDVNSTSDYMHIPHRTGLEPWLTVRKPIISPIFSPTLLQIYCIKLIGHISYSFWVWATIGDLTQRNCENVRLNFKLHHLSLWSFWFCPFIFKYYEFLILHISLIRIILCSFI